MNTTKNILKRERKITKFFSIISACLIILLLVINSPAQAFVLNLSSDDKTINIGEKAVFYGEINLEESERLNVDEIIFELEGPKNISCRFDIFGKAINGCSGIKIELIEGSVLDFSYGYGYEINDSTLKYKITLSTNNYKTGNYASRIKIKSGDDFFVKEGSGIKINPESSGSGCRTNWDCSEWSECVEGKQVRTCLKEDKYCFAGEKPEEIKQCSLWLSELKTSDMQTLEKNLIVGLPDKTESSYYMPSKRENNPEIIKGVMGVVSGESGIGDYEAIILAALLIGILGLMICIAAVSRARRRKITRRLRKRSMSQGVEHRKHSTRHFRRSSGVLTMMIVFLLLMANLLIALYLLI